MSLGIMGIPAGKIKSIQRGTITIAAASLSNTATITAVVLAKSVLHLVDWSTAYTATIIGTVKPRIELTNTTTVTATREGNGGAVTTTVSYEVIESY